MIKKNCVIYARVSTDEQKKRGYSLPDQEIRLREYAERESYEIIREFSAEESAKAPGRKCFDEMLDFVSENEIPYIFVLNTDRLYRNDEDKLTIRDMIEEDNLTVILVEENMTLDKEDEADVEMFHDIKCAFAKNEIKRNKRRVKKAQNRKAKQGGFNGLAPLGYLNTVVSDRHVIIPDPERAPFVRLAFELYARGTYSLRELGKILFDKGFRTRKGNRIGKASLACVLQNVFYTGWISWKDELISGTHKAIVDEELFEKVQKIIKARDTSSRMKKRWFAFRGLLVCGYCGCLITAEEKKGKYIYYHCTGSKGACEQGRYKEEAIDALFAEEVGKLEVNKNVEKEIKGILKEEMSKEEGVTKGRLKKLKTDLANLETKKNQIYEDRLNGVIDGDFVKARFREIDDSMKVKRIEIEELERENPDYLPDLITFIDWLKDVKNTYLNCDKGEKRELLDILAYNYSLNGVSSSFQWRKPFDSWVELAETQNSLD